MSATKHYSAHNIEARLLAAIRAAGLDPEQGFSQDALAALDQFHTGGLNASLELLTMAAIAPDEQVLDIGAGLAGGARLLASRCGCRVTCVELSRDFCDGAALLNRLTGLENRIAIHCGSALELPFADDSFHVAWMQNVGMNIRDKAGLYAEISRVLKPGGRFVFQELAAGETPTSYFPLPWAGAPGDSHLATPAKMTELLEKCGLVADIFEDISEAHLQKPAAPAQPSPLSLEVYVDGIAQKGDNAARSLQEGQIRFVRGVFRLR